MQINSEAYRKIPVISPGLIQLRKGFWVGLWALGGGGGGGGAYKWSKKYVLKRATAVLID